MQRHQLGLPGVLFVLLACSHCDGSGRTAASSSASPRPAPADADAGAPDDASALRANLQVIEKRETYTTQGGKCAVEVIYPSISGLKDAAAEAKANERLKQRAFDGIAQECLAARDAQPARTNGRCADLPPQGATEVVVRYRIGLLRGDLLSVRYQRSDCSNPSLHPNDVSGGLTLDLGRDIVYPLEDLFRPGSGWEKVLLSLVQRDLKQKQPDVTVKRLESRDYYLTDRAIVLMNLVQARAFHALEVQIPFDDVRSILRESGPLNALLPGPGTTAGPRSPGGQP